MDLILLFSMNKYSRCGRPIKASSLITSKEFDVNNKSCSDGVNKKLPSEISVKPDLTKDSEITSGGTVRGMDLAFSHKALSLLQVHTAGHFGFAGFFPSVSKTTEKRHRK